MPSHPSRAVPDPPPTFPTLPLSSATQSLLPQLGPFSCPPPHSFAPSLHSPASSASNAVRPLPIFVDIPALGPLSVGWPRTKWEGSPTAPRDSQYGHPARTVGQLNRFGFAVAVF